jgi:hypothetical protein
MSKEEEIKGLIGAVRKYRAPSKTGRCIDVKHCGNEFVTITLFFARNAFVEAFVSNA